MSFRNGVPVLGIAIHMMLQSSTLATATVELQPWRDRLAAVSATAEANGDVAINRQINQHSDFSAYLYETYYGDDYFYYDSYELGSNASTANGSASSKGATPGQSEASKTVEPTSDDAWLKTIVKEGGTWTLRKGTYIIKDNGGEGQYQLKSGTRITGAGSGKAGTVIEVEKRGGFKDICAKSNRRGFLLGDSTYIGKLHFVGRDDKRACDNRLLCGGAPFETPGCFTTGMNDDWTPNCNTKGVENATVEDVTIEKNTVQIAFYMNPTNKDKPMSKNIQVIKMRTDGTWADGMNLHGPHQNVMVKDCVLKNAGDDCYAIWSTPPGADGIKFLNNTAENCNFRPNCDGRKESGSGGNFCFIAYGGIGSSVINNTCEGAMGNGVMAMGNIRGARYGGTFSDKSHTTVTGNKRGGKTADKQCWTKQYHVKGCT